MLSSLLRPLKSHGRALVMAFIFAPTVTLTMKPVKHPLPDAFSRAPLSFPTPTPYGYLTDTAQPIGLLEVRNYVTKASTLDQFISLFETQFLKPQEALNGYPISGYRVAGAPSNFCWFRGFQNWNERSAFLPRFYSSSAWLHYRDSANRMLANNDNVYLLHPLGLQHGQLVPIPSVPAAALAPREGLAVIDIYIANTKRERLKTLLAQTYLPLAQQNGVTALTFWECELTPNDFPRLPVFQDPNVVVQISFYKDEARFKAAQQQMAASLTPAQKADLQDAITQHQLWMLQPTAQSLRP